MFSQKLDLTDEKEFGWTNSSAENIYWIFSTGWKKTWNIFSKHRFVTWTWNVFTFFRNTVSILYLYEWRLNIFDQHFYTVIEEWRLSFLVSILKTYLLRWRLFLFDTKHYFEILLSFFLYGRCFWKIFYGTIFLKIMHQFSLWYIFF